MRYYNVNLKFPFNAVHLLLAFSTGRTVYHVRALVQKYKGLNLKSYSTVLKTLQKDTILCDCPFNILLLLPGNECATH